MPLVIDNKKAEAQNNNDRNEDKEQYQYDQQQPQQIHPYPGVMAQNGATYFYQNNYMGYGEPNNYVNPYDGNVQSPMQPGLGTAYYAPPTMTPYIYGIPTPHHGIAYATANQQIFPQAPTQMAVMTINYGASASVIPNGSDMPSK